MSGAKTKNMAKKPPEIEVCFFGGFQIKADSKVINDAASRAKRPWSLLQFLMVNRHKFVTHQQLIEAMWPDETSEQPEKALKNLVYRVRSAFAAKDVPNASQVVLYQGGNYCLNNEFSWKMDFELFDENYDKALNEATPRCEAIEYALFAIELYKGDFLQEQAYENWILQFNTHYRSKYFSLIAVVLNMLKEEGRDDDIEDVCNRAFGIDQFEENIHLEYMQALVRQGKKSTALAHYGRMESMFYSEMGVLPCDELRQLNQELTIAMNNAEADLAAIKELLAEDEVKNQAFVCGFDVFRSLYQLEARAAERAGEMVFVGLLTLRTQDGATPSEEALKKNMPCLLEAVSMSLRRGDVVSMFSSSQYILMLPTITVENAQIVMSRISEQFCPEQNAQAVMLDVKIQPLEPVVM